MTPFNSDPSNPQFVDSIKESTLVLHLLERGYSHDTVQKVFQFVEGDADDIFTLSNLHTQGCPDLEQLVAIMEETLVPGERIHCKSFIAGINVNSYGLEQDIYSDQGLYTISPQTQTSYLSAIDEQKMDLLVRNGHEQDTVNSLYFLVGDADKVYIVARIAEEYEQPLSSVLDLMNDRPDKWVEMPELDFEEVIRSYSGVIASEVTDS